ncbi:acetyl esterase/lipase [Streptomyces netropsis]|uniref:Acetyl esterase/lipase n=1 Tax=Streptomyces netropsis TaxID=55404 RepID=A0A7W7LIZ2_STRNE|nr:alpha/beta hydrolase [Streptomyces netropsis]MBB4890501.1 acetyl esterase/lipase [Streptomyces netropsis]
MSTRRAPSEHGRFPTPKAVPPFDPELSVAVAAMGKEPREPLTPDNLEARQQRDAATRPRPTAEDLRTDGRFEVTELCVPGPPDGPDVTLVSARPAGLAGPLPLLYYMHGGAMITGNAWSVLPRILREWALPLELAVISVEYRLAPQAQYPSPLEDCYAGLVWAAGHAAELHIDADRIIIGGKSAGGGLAAALALLTRDRGGPQPLGQLLLCPMLDDRNNTFSSHQMTGIDMWDLTSNATAWKALLGDRYGAADLPPYAAPSRATDLTRLPPAYIEAGSAEMFRDEDTAYANAIWQAGGQAELHIWPGAYHGFDSRAPQAALSQDARNARTRWLQRLLTQSSTRNQPGLGLAAAQSAGQSPATRHPK